MPCDFCSNIVDLVKMKEGTFRNWRVPSDMQNTVRIVRDPETDEYGIWSDGGGDIFLSGVMIDNIVACPKCGRLLKGAENNGRKL